VFRSPTKQKEMDGLMDGEQNCLGGGDETKQWWLSMFWSDRSIDRTAKHALSVLKFFRRNTDVRDPSMMTRFRARSIASVRSSSIVVCRYPTIRGPQDKTTANHQVGIGRLHRGE
jgi:hypothetical protein